jgi:hypothetical protein
MLKTAARILCRLGLAETTRAFTDVDRRKIRSMLDSGMTPGTIMGVFGYSCDEIEQARQCDFLTGKLP